MPALFEHCGHLLLIEHEEDLVSGQARALMQNQHGTETQVLDATQVRDHEPGVSDRVIGALYCPHDGVSDHTATTHAFADAIRRAGAKLEEGAKVLDIKFEGDRTTAVLTSDGRRIEVGHGLYILANAGVQPLLSARLELPIWSRTFQVLLTNPQPGKAVRQRVR